MNTPSREFGEMCSTEVALRLCNDMELYELVESKIGTEIGDEPTLPIKFYWQGWGAEWFTKVSKLQDFKDLFPGREGVIIETNVHRSGNKDILPSEIRRFGSRVVIFEAKESEQVIAYSLDEGFIPDPTLNHNKLVGLLKSVLDKSEPLPQASIDTGDGYANSSIYCGIQQAFYFLPRTQESLYRDKPHKQRLELLEILQEILWEFLKEHPVLARDYAIPAFLERYMDDVPRGEIPGHKVVELFTMGRVGKRVLRDIRFNSTIREYLLARHSGSGPELTTLQRCGWDLLLKKIYRSMGEW